MNLDEIFLFPLFACHILLLFMAGGSEEDVVPSLSTCLIVGQLRLDYMIRYINPSVRPP